MPRPRTLDARVLGIEPPFPEAQLIVQWALEVEGPLSGDEITERTKLDRLLVGDSLVLLSAEDLAYRDNQGKWNLYASSPYA